MKIIAIPVLVIAQADAMAGGQRVRARIFYEHRDAVKKIIEIAMESPPDIATLVKLIKVPDPMRIEIVGRGKQYDVEFDVQNWGHATMHPEQLLCIIQLLGEIREKIPKTPGINQAISQLVKIAECDGSTTDGCNIGLVMQAYIVQSRFRTADMNEKGYAPRNAAYFSLGQFGADAKDILPILEKKAATTGDEVIPKLAVAMIRYDIFARQALDKNSKDNDVLASYKKAMESVPYLSKVAGSSAFSCQARLKAIDLLGEFGGDAKESLGILQKLADKELAEKEKALQESAKEAIQTKGLGMALVRLTELKKFNEDNPAIIRVAAQKAINRIKKEK